MSEKILLPKVDELKITLVMDNSIDVLMAGSDIVKRLPLAPNQFERLQAIAQHGFSALIRVTRNQKSGVVLFDTGVTRDGILHNIVNLTKTFPEIKHIPFAILVESSLRKIKHIASQNIKN